MKEIWINLELYIKSYEFYILRDFFWIFLITFTILNIKNDLNKGKKGDISARDPRGCDVARKATWQRHAGPRGDVTRIIFTYIGDIIYIVFHLSEEIIKSPKPSHVINISLLFNFSRVGLSSTWFL